MMNIKTLSIIALTMLVTLNAYALEQPQPVQPVGPYPRLNKVHFNLTAEQWVSTKTAKVIVSVDGNLNQSGMDKLQANVLDNLKKLSKDGEWRITQFSRSQDQSDLEKVHIRAEARLPEGQLAGIRTNAKNLSKPGMKYQIADIQYSPSLTEIEAVRDQVRNKLYQQAKTEIDQLTKIYGQSFYINQLTFGYDGAPPQPMARFKQQATLGAASAESFAPGGGGNMAVSQKIVIVADVVAASTVQ